jgi:hypothetical protein
MAVFYYGIKQLIIPAVVKMIDAYDAFIYKLQHDRQDVISDYQVVLKKIDEQEDQFQSIETKFLVWERVCNIRRIERVVEQKKIELSLQNRFNIRSDIVMNELAIKERLPYILDQVTQQLQAKYQVSEFQKKYTEDLIDIMKEQL